MRSNVDVIASTMIIYSIRSRANLKVWMIHISWKNGIYTDNIEGICRTTKLNGIILDYISKYLGGQ